MKMGEIALKMVRQMSEQAGHGQAAAALLSWLVVADCSALPAQQWERDRELWRR